MINVFVHSVDKTRCRLAHLFCLQQKAVAAVSLGRPLGTAGSIVVNTPGGVTGTQTFATINKRVSQAGTPIQVTTAVSVLGVQFILLLPELIQIMLTSKGSTLTRRG